MFFILEQVLIFVTLLAIRGARLIFFRLKTPHFLSKQWFVKENDASARQYCIVKPLPAYSSAVKPKFHGLNGSIITKHDILLSILHSPTNPFPNHARPPAPAPARQLQLPLRNFLRSTTRMPSPPKLPLLARSASQTPSHQKKKI